MTTISQDLAKAAHDTTPALERAGDAARVAAATFAGFREAWEATTPAPMSPRVTQALESLNRTVEDALA